MILRSFSTGGGRKGGGGSCATGGEELDSEGSGGADGGRGHIRRIVRRFDGSRLSECDVVRGRLADSTLAVKKEGAKKERRLVAVIALDR